MRGQSLTASTSLPLIRQCTCSEKLSRPTPLQCGKVLRAQGCCSQLSTVGTGLLPRTRSYSVVGRPQLLLQHIMLSWADCVSQVTPRPMTRDLRMPWDDSRLPACLTSNAGVLSLSLYLQTKNLSLQVGGLIISPRLALLTPSLMRE